MLQFIKLFTVQLMQIIDIKQAIKVNVDSKSLVNILYSTITRIYMHR